MEFCFCLFSNFSLVFTFRTVSLMLNVCGSAWKFTGMVSVCVCALHVWCMYVTNWPFCLSALVNWSPGETFDRQASIRRSLINTDTLVRRPKKVKRRKTISGVPDSVQEELGMVWLCQLSVLLLLPQRFPFRWPCSHPHVVYSCHHYIA